MSYMMSIDWGGYRALGDSVFSHEKVSFAQSASRGVDRMDGFTGYASVTQICTETITHIQTLTVISLQAGGLC